MLLKILFLLCNDYTIPIEQIGFENTKETLIILCNMQNTCAQKNNEDLLED